MPIEGYFPNYEKMSEAEIQNRIHQMGLDLPMPVQLFNFFKNLLKGDLGTSLKYRNNVPVTEILAPKTGFGKARFHGHTARACIGPAYGNSYGKVQGQVF
jgi:hypothetical protein